MSRRVETGPLQARLARLARAGSDAARARTREAAGLLAAGIAEALAEASVEVAETPGGAAVTVAAPGLAAREFGTATQGPHPVIGPAVARLPGRA